MNQAEKRVFLIKRLLDEDRRYRGMEIPADALEQKRMLRSLMNIRRPQAIDAEFLTIQDEYLRREIEDAGITRLDDLKLLAPGGISHSGPGENRQLWPDENSQS